MELLSFSFFFLISDQLISESVFSFSKSFSMLLISSTWFEACVPIAPFEQAGAFCTFDMGSFISWHTIEWMNSEDKNWSDSTTATTTEIMRKEIRILFIMRWSTGLEHISELVCIQLFLCCSDQKRYFTKLTTQLNPIFVNCICITGGHVYNFPLTFFLSYLVLVSNTISSLCQCFSSLFQSFPSQIFHHSLKIFACAYTSFLFCEEKVKAARSGWYLRD